MKKIALAIVLLGSVPALSADYVRGYTRKDGTYVQPHYRSSPDSSRLNNYSTQGNYNPYTGERGTVNPYSQPQPTYQPPVQQPHAPLYSPGYR